MKMTQFQHSTVCISRQFLGLKCNRRCYQYHQLPSILKSVKHPSTLRQLHAHILTSGAALHNVSLSNNLIYSYSSFRLISDSHKVFHGILHKNVFSWTILIHGLVQNYMFSEAVESFAQLLGNGLFPNEVTMSSILPAFSNLGMTIMGKAAHCFWFRQGFVSNVVVDTCFVDMYSRFGCMSVARHLFDEMPVRNVVSWNVIISGYAKNGMVSDAMHLFNLMRINGTHVDCFTIMNLISASSIDNWGRTSTAVHGFIVRVGYNNDPKVQTALINMYTSGSLISEAYSVFREMCFKDAVAWTLMLEALTSGQYWSKAIKHCNEMMCVTNIVLDSTAIVSILSSCSCLGALQQGRRVHALVEKRGFNKDVFVGSSVIAMYANCGVLVDARKYFDTTEEKDIACWNAMIRAMGVNGNTSDAIHLLFRMDALGINPNESTFVSALSACSHAGMVDEGLQIFCHMLDRWSIVPSLQHYACIVDLFSRSGQLDGANLVISRMPLDPHSGVYGSLLSGCRVYGNTRIGAEIFHKLIKLDLLDAGHFCSVSNMYASLGNWGCTKVSHVAVMKKEPGSSLIEINQEVYIFMAGERDHIKHGEFDVVLQSLLLNNKDANLYCIN